MDHLINNNNSLFVFLIKHNRFDPFRGVKVNQKYVFFFVVTNNQTTTKKPYRVALSNEISFLRFEKIKFLREIFLKK